MISVFPMSRKLFFLSPFRTVLIAIHMQVTDRPSPDAPSLTQAIIVQMVYCTCSCIEHRHDTFRSRGNQNLFDQGGHPICTDFHGHTRYGEKSLYRRFKSFPGVFAQTSTNGDISPLECRSCQKMNLKMTSLRSLGLTRGKAMIR